MANEFIRPNDLINKLERYEGQNPLIFEDMIHAACDLANQYHYPLREVSFALLCPYPFPPDISLPFPSLPLL